MARERSSFKQLGLLLLPSRDRLVATDAEELVSALADLLVEALEEEHGEEGGANDVDQAKTHG
jgi:hypothetical protein